MSFLWAVNQDPNTHSGGGLIPTTTDVFINNQLVIVKGNHAQPDALCPVGTPHCDPIAVGASSDVFANNIPAHRFQDQRSCGATTVVVGQTNVFCN